MTRIIHRESGRMGQDAPKVERPHPLEKDAIFGSWDFKWPVGTAIKVAFQFPHWLDQARDADRETFVKVIQSIRTQAEQWRGANLSFSWFGLESNRMPDLVFAPSDPTDRDRSTALLSPTASQYGKANYDVLISLEKLSQDGAKQSREGTRLMLPSAELGTYNRRADYGVPTAYLGPLGAWGSAPSADYYLSGEAPNELQNLAKFHIVHEFGHILGLIHAHQDPVRRSTNDGTLRAPTPGTSREEVQELLVTLLNTRLGLDRKHVSQQVASMVGSQVMAVWPGNERHSDWSRVHGPSVMTVPYLHCLLGDNPAPPRVCPVCEAEVKQYQTPTRGDLELLRALYS